jgi:hypothetical protein
MWFWASCGDVISLEHFSSVNSQFQVVVIFLSVYFLLVRLLGFA